MMPSVRNTFLIVYTAGWINAVAQAEAPSAWVDRFNAASQAMDGSDWESAIKIQESLIGDGIVTASILKNLAIARSKQHELAQSLAAWLAAKNLDPRDPVIQSGIEGTLAAMQLGPESLDLSAQGPVAEWFASRTHRDFLVYLTVAMGCLVITVILLGMKLLRSKKAGFIHAVVQRVTIPMIVLTCISWLFVLMVYLRLGSWGAVVDHKGAALRMAPNETATELTRLKLGTPIFVTGDTYNRWLDIRTADGQHGYVDSLSVRVIRLAF